MDNFKKVLEECDMFDLGFQGSKFTWSNCWDDEFFMEERLDRMVANRAWCGMYLEVDVFVDPALSSDHTPLIMDLRGRSQGENIRRVDRFEDHWAMELEGREIVKQVWHAKGVIQDSWQSIGNKLERCKRSLVF